jgi:hypothetical protein
MRQKKLSAPMMKLSAILAAFIFLIGGGLFYWYEYRPAMVRENCSSFAEKESGKDVFVYEIIYRHCLRKHGIEYYGSDGQRTE